MKLGGDMNCGGDMDYGSVMTPAASARRLTGFRQPR